MGNDKIIGVVSAYGAMTECDSRYRALIYAENAEEFNAKLKAFMCAETVRAMSAPEIAREIGRVNPAKVYETLAEFSLPEEGEREVIEVSELSTDYHVENPAFTSQEGVDVDPSSWKNAIVMTEYGMECFGPSEFPSVVALYDPASEKDEEGNAILQEYTDLHHGTLLMTSSELESHLLGWERHVIHVM